MKHGRRDLNHAKIRDGLRKCGWTVEDTADAGDGKPDLVAGTHGVTYLIEIKSEKGKESNEQTEKRLAWRGGPWIVVRSLEEVLAVEADRIRRSEAA